MLHIAAFVDEMKNILIFTIFITKLFADHYSLIFEIGNY